MCLPCCRLCDASSLLSGRISFGGFGFRSSESCGFVEVCWALWLCRVILDIHDVVQIINVSI